MVPLVLGKHFYSGTSGRPSARSFIPTLEPSGLPTLLHSSLPLDPQTPLPVSLPNPFIPLTHGPRPVTLLLIPLTRPSSSMPMTMLARDEALDLLTLGEVARLIEDEDDVHLRGLPPRVVVVGLRDRWVAMVLVGLVLRACSSSPA